jgi:hypothetical protein
MGAARAAERETSVMKRKRTVFTVTEKDGKRFYSRVGWAIETREGLAITLEVTPANGRLIIASDELHL